VSRKDIFDSEESEDGSGTEEVDGYMPDLVFEEVQHNEGNGIPQEGGDEYFLFPLFGGASVESTKVKISDEVMEEERVSVTRPDSYYFYKTEDELRKQYEQVAVTGLDIIQDSKISLPGMRMTWKVIDFTALAEKVKNDNRKRRSRPGKKTRQERRKHPRRENRTHGESEYGPQRTYGSNLKPQAKQTMKSRFGGHGRGGRGSSHMRGRDGKKGRNP
jgi:hypothetical protein